jgi:hypothetical protein
LHEKLSLYIKHSFGVITDRYLIILGHNLIANVIAIHRHLSYKSIFHNNDLVIVCVIISDVIRLNSLIKRLTVIYATSLLGITDNILADKSNNSIYESIKLVSAIILIESSGFIHLFIV